MTDLNPPELIDSAGARRPDPAAATSCGATTMTGPSGGCFRGAALLHSPSINQASG